MANQKLDDSDRFNLMLALTGLLVQGDEYTVEELAKHFTVSQAEIVKAVETIGYTDLIGFSNTGRYIVDYDEIKEGYVSIKYDLENVVEEVPRLSSRQASALAAGLVYLSSLPGLADIKEIDELRAILASGNSKGKSAELILDPGSRDSDLIVLSEAIARGLSISCDYLSLKGVTTLNRIIEPRRLDSQGEILYLRGWCPEAGAPRSFRLDRMRNATLTDSPISEAAKSAVIVEDIYVASETDTTVTIEVDPEAFSLISDFKPAEEPESVGKFSKRFKVKVGDVRNLGRIITKFGGSARVVSPESAKLAVREFALNALGQASPSSPKDAE